jgi:hypothetical protein
MACSGCAKRKAAIKRVARAIVNAARPKPAPVTPTAPKA